MRKKNILKAAGVLLIAIAMISSSIAIADTQIKESTIELNTSHKGSGSAARGEIVWDNGMNYDGLLAAQEPSSPANLDAYPADDFHFEEDTEVCDVHWIGGYYNGDPQEWDWCILFYYDRGDGNAPGNVYAGKFCYSWADIAKQELEPGYYQMWVDLPENIMFPACEKFWISIWAVGDHFPQSAWGYHQDPIIMHEAVLKSDWFGVPDWTDTSLLLGYAVDMCFQLTTKGEPCEELCCEGQIYWNEEGVPPGSTQRGQFEVCNCGCDCSILCWEIISWPEWGNWTFNPPSGILHAPDCITVDVSCQVPDESEKEFTGEIIVKNCQDPDEICIIPVYCKTPKVKEYSRTPFLQMLFERFPNAFPILQKLLGM